MTSPEERERRSRRRKRNLIAKELRELKYYSPKVLKDNRLKDKKLRLKDILETDDDI